MTAAPVIAGSLPDLSVQNVWIEKVSQFGQPASEISPGEEFYVVATVTNSGDATASGYYVDAYYDSEYGRGGPDDIAPGELQEWYVGPITAQSGTHTAKWVVDPDNQIAELNELNNEGQYSFTVGSQTATTLSTTTTTSTCYAISPQAGPTVPVSDVSVALFGASEMSAYFVGTSNPYDNQALLGAWGKASAQQELGPWTRSDWIDQATGQPLVPGDLLLVAGPIANPVLRYYSSQELAVGFGFSNGYAQVVYRCEVLAQMPERDIGSGKDIFVVQALKDGDRSILAIWGIGAQGTLASGVWLVNNFSQLGSLNNSIYIYGWTDSNGDIYAQPDEISLIYQGD